METKSISIRIDKALLNRLKRAAKEKGIGYQTLLKLWIMERLEQEIKKGNL